MLLQRTRYKKRIRPCLISEAMEAAGECVCEQQDGAGDDKKQGGSQKGNWVFVHWANGYRITADMLKSYGGLEVNQCHSTEDSSSVYTFVHLKKKVRQSSIDKFFANVKDHYNFRLHDMRDEGAVGSESRKAGGTKIQDHMGMQMLARHMNEKNPAFNSWTDGRAEVTEGLLFAMRTEQATHSEEGVWKAAAENWKAKYDRIVERMECQLERHRAKEKEKTSMSIKMMEMESEMVVQAEEIEKLKKREIALVNKHQEIQALGSDHDMNKEAQKMKVNSLSAQVEEYRARAAECRQSSEASKLELIMYTGMMVENRLYENYRDKYDALQARMRPMEKKVAETDEELKRYQMQYYFFERNAGIKRSELEKELRSKEAELSGISVRLRTQTDEVLIAENKKLREVCGYCCWVESLYMILTFQTAGDGDQQAGVQGDDLEGQRAVQQGED